MAVNHQNHFQNHQVLTCLNSQQSIQNCHYTSLKPDYQTGESSAQEAGLKGIREIKQEVFIVVGCQRCHYREGPGTKRAPQVKVFLLPGDRGELQIHDASAALTSPGLTGLLFLWLHFLYCQWKVSQKTENLTAAHLYMHTFFYHEQQWQTETGSYNHRECIHSLTRIHKGDEDTFGSNKEAMEL